MAALIIAAAPLLNACSHAGPPRGTPSGGPTVEYPDTGLDDIHSLDIYLDGVTLHALLSGIRSSQRAPELVYLRSDDGGASWSSPMRLASAAAGPAAARRGNDVQLAASGDRIVALWRVAGPAPGVTQIATALSRDGGHTWRSGPNPGGTNDGVDQGYAGLAADRSGRFHLIWLDDREETGRSQGLRYARSSDGGHHWAGHTTIDTATCTCCWTTLVSGSDETLEVLYRDVEPHDMALAHSRDGGSNWHHAGPVGRFGWDFTGCPHAGGGLAITRTSGFTSIDSVVWTGAESALGLYHLRSTNGGRTWTAPHPLTAGQATHSDIAALDPSRLAAAWEAPAARGVAIVVSRSADHGHTWSRPEPLSSTGHYASHPRIVATRFGFRAFWTERREQGTTRWATARVGDTVAVEKGAPGAAHAVVGLH